MLEENTKMDKDWKNTICVALFLMSSGYFCLVIFSMIYKLNLYYYE